MARFGASKPTRKKRTGRKRPPGQSLFDRARKIGDPVLHAPCEPVADIDGEVRMLAGKLRRLTDRDPLALGLSAPQIGVSKRVAAVRPTLDTPSIAILNPEIIEHSTEPITRWEGCFSLSLNKGVMCARWSAIVVRYQSLDGEWHTEPAEGDWALVLQHEIEHLDGKTVCDHGEVVPPPFDPHEETP